VLLVLYNGLTKRC